MLYKALDNDVNWKNIVEISHSFNAFYKLLEDASKERSDQNFKIFLDENEGHFDDIASRNTMEWRPTVLVDIKGNKVKIGPWGTDPFISKSPFKQWMSSNFPQGKDGSAFFDSKRAVDAAWKNLRAVAFFGLRKDSEARRAFKGLVETLKDMSHEVTRRLQDTYPKRFKYLGFNIYNPDRLSKYVVNNMLEGIEALVALFKKRSMIPALKNGVTKIVLRFARKSDGHAMATYYHNGREITLLQWAINPKIEKGLYTKNIVEFFIHEFGHYVHQDFISEDAKHVWDEGWTTLEEARYREKAKHYSKGVIPDDRNKYWDLVEKANYDFKKVAMDLEGIDKEKYMRWLNDPSFGAAKKDQELSYDPTEVVLTPYAKKMIKFFRDPKSWKEEWKKKYENDPLYGEDYKNQQADTYYDRQRSIYLKNMSLGHDDMFTTHPSASSYEMDTAESDKILKEMGLPTAYAGKNLKEDFAETFTAFLFKPESLSKIARYRMERTLSLSGLYGKPVMQLAEAVDQLVLKEHIDLALELLSVVKKGMQPLRLWHGSQRFTGHPEIQPAGKKKSEYGSGLYLTTSADTARKYAKGGGVVLLFELDPHLTFLKFQKIPLQEALDFLDSRPRLRNKKKNAADLQMNADRFGGDEVMISALTNLMHYHGALTGNHGPALAQFYVDYGIDGELVTQANEDWVVLFNMRKIRDWKKVPAGEAHDFDLIRNKY